MKTRLEIAELAALLMARAPKSKPHMVAEDALLIVRCASGAESGAVALCNGVLSQERWDAKRERLAKRLAPVVARYWLTARLGGDPRGYCLHLLGTPDAPLRGNTWGGDGDGYGV